MVGPAEPSTFRPRHRVPSAAAFGRGVAPSPLTVLPRGHERSHFTDKKTEPQTGVAGRDRRSLGATRHGPGPAREPVLISLILQREEQPGREDTPGLAPTRCLRASTLRRTAAAMRSDAGLRHRLTVLDVTSSDPPCSRMRRGRLCFPSVSWKRLPLEATFAEGPAQDINARMSEVKIIRLPLPEARCPRKSSLRPNQSSSNWFNEAMTQNRLRWLLPRGSGSEEKHGRHRRAVDAAQ